MDVDEFVARWRRTQASERANKDSFLKELCRVLGVPEPDGKTGDPALDDYVFEADAKLWDEDGHPHVGWMDLFKRDAFILEAKQGSERKRKRVGTAKRGTPGWYVAMTEAAGQAFRYARTLDEPPPFAIVADIGYCFDLYACFDGNGAYRPFPNAQKNRLYLADLATHRDLLRAIWIDPFSLDPRLRAEAVTRDVARQLAELARDLEGEGHPPGEVARFLLRCIFTMFAEDVGLLRDHIFTQALEKQWLAEPSAFKDGVEALWDAMNAGKPFFWLGKLLRFNGGLFANPVALPLRADQLKRVLAAARCDWSAVEPAIFGTLVERALDPSERHRLGAHFTPRAYVEQLLGPAIEAPLRADWDVIRVQVRELVPPGEPAKKAHVERALALVRGFHEKLCATRVLDPACGSGNFLYVALDVFKRLESEVLGVLADLGARQQELAQPLVNPSQFLGIEVRRWSKEIADLVLWIGYLQWHHRTYGGTKAPPEPVLHDYKNVACRDAVLADNGAPAAWPRADFIVGNPPFVGNKLMRAVLGDEYVTQLRRAYPDVPDTSDLAMYWWHKAACTLRDDPTLRAFGLISTKAITQVFNSKVVRHHLDAEPPISITFAIPNHPWVAAADGAAVRVAMTVLQKGTQDGVLAEVEEESKNDTSDGADVEVSLRQRHGRISANLRIGVDVRDVTPLSANVALCQQGVKLVQPRDLDGFIVRRDDLAAFGGADGKIIVPYLTNKELVQRRKDRFVIDFFGYDEAAARRVHPAAFQRVLEQVRPFRLKNRDLQRKKNWWLFGRSNEQMRASIAGLDRFIVTSEVAKHRVFVFVKAPLVPDASLYVIGSDDAFVLGVLSSRVHVCWATQAGGRMGVGDDPRYQSGPCFDPFPFPDPPVVTRSAIAELAEEIDAHRKRARAQWPDLTLTDMYNVLHGLRDGRTLTDREAEINRRGFVSVLGKLHDDLDVAVAAAYGWGTDLSDDEILQHLVALNRTRAAEEDRSIVHWLRPDFQRSQAAPRKARRARERADQLSLFPWPADLPQQVAAVRDLMDASDVALTARDVASRYDGAKPRGVVPALETLEALGLVVGFSLRRERRWKGLAKARSATSGTGRSSRPPAPRIYEQPEGSFLLAADPRQRRTPGQR